MKKIFSAIGRFLKTNYLGNLNDKDFNLNDKNLPCTQKYCTGTPAKP